MAGDLKIHFRSRDDLRAANAAASTQLKSRAGVVPWIRQHPARRTHHSHEAALYRKPGAGKSRAELTLGGNVDEYLRGARLSGVAAQIRNDRLGVFNPQS